MNTNLTQLVMMVCCMSLTVFTMPAQAEKADKQKPALIEADSSKHDELKQAQVFEGNVVLNKGTLSLKADRIEANTDAQGFQYIKAIGSATKLVQFRQKREGVNEWMEGESVTLDFDGKADTVLLGQKAMMKKLAGTVMQDEVRGETILYANQTEVYTVKGGANSAATGGRVKAIIMPKELVTNTTSKP